MFYRYEAMDKDGTYKGIFTFFNSSQRRYFNRFLREPKWYQNNPNVNSRCWFTAEGYEKYHSLIDELIHERGIKNFRILKRDSIENIVCKGKIQCIEAI